MRLSCNSRSARSGRQALDVTRGVKKGDLPSKICATCGRPFTWRKKWERSWNEVRYCSDRCRRQAGKPSEAGSA